MAKNRRRLLVEFAETTSTPGFGSFRRSRLVFRLLWVFILSIAWILGLFISIQLITNYVHYQSKVSVKIQTSSRVPFPAITICNLNPFKKEELQQVMSANAYNAINSDLSGIDFIAIFGNASATKVLTDEGPFEQSSSAEMNDSSIISTIPTTTSSPTSQNISTAIPNTYSNYRQGATSCKNLACIRLDMSPINRAIALLQFYAFNNRFNFTHLGHSIESMLLSCTFQGIRCSASNFTSWDHSLYGRCHTMAIDRSYPSFVGVAMGLALTLNVDSEHYLPLISSAVGFQVLLHPIEYVPFPEDAGFAISPGASTKVAMQQQVFSRLPYPYDGQHCGTLRDTAIALLPSRSWNELLQTFGVASDMNYTAPLCFHSCYILQCLAMCNCVDPDSITYSSINEYFVSIGKRLTVGACDATDQITWKCMHKVVNTIQSNPQICTNQCPQPCYEVKYQSQVTANSWPRINSTEYIRYSAMLPSYVDLSSHLVNLNVYFQDLNYESITENASANVYDLLADIGGTFGLFIGACALTLVDFIQLLLALIGCKEAKRRRSSTSMPPPSPALSKKHSTSDAANGNCQCATAEETGGGSRRCSSECRQ